MSYEKSGLIIVLSLLIESLAFGPRAVCAQATPVIHENPASLTTQQPFDVNGKLMLQHIIKYNIVAQILFALLVFILGYAYVARGRIFRRQEPDEPQTDQRGALIASMKARLPLSTREIEEIKKKL